MPVEVVTIGVNTEQIRRGREVIQVVGVGGTYQVETRTENPIAGNRPGREPAVIANIGAEAAVGVASGENADPVRCRINYTVSDIPNYL